MTPLRQVAGDPIVGTPIVGRPIVGTPISDTIEWLRAVQLRNGMIPWFAGGHADPWNHVEAAMALSVGGAVREAERAFEWLQATQRADGAWHTYYLASGQVEEPRLDTNVSAYVATGVWHHFLVTGDSGFLEDLWEPVERAMGFVIGWQRPGGELVWSVEPDGTPGSYGLLTGSASAYFSLRCAIACAFQLGLERPEWELAAGRLRHAVAHGSGGFAPKHEFAMDWYYPVLSGALEGHGADRRIDLFWDTFVMEGLGVRCVSTGPWVTAAETAECVLALDVVGRREQAASLLYWTRAHRCADGSYLTGIVYPQRDTFPREERTSYTAGAVVLAADALSNATPGSGLFRGEFLPAGLDLTEPRRVERPF